MALAKVQEVNAMHLMGNYKRVFLLDFLNLE